MTTQQLYREAMKLNIIIFISILTVLTSCNGQTNTQTHNSEKLNKLFPAGDTVKELSNNIMVIYQDRKNNYWFGSWQDGLYKYNGKSIIHYTEKDGLAAKRVEEIKEDRQGNIYFNTTEGLFQYNGNSFSKLTETISSEHDWKLNPDDLWFKGIEYSGYVYRFDGDNLYKLKFPKTELGEDYIQKHPNYPNPYAVYCIYKDSKQNIWFGTATLGVCRFNGKSFDWISEQDVTEIHDGPANGVRSIAEDKNGDFWFNTEYRYTIYDNKQDNGTFYNRIKSIGNLDGKDNSNLNEYLSITKDNDNNLWFATYSAGVWKYDGTKITHYPVQLNSKDITLFSIYNDNNGKLWLGTHENGVFKFNGQTFNKFTL